MKRTPPARPLLLPLTPLYRLACSLRAFQLRTGLLPVRRLRFPVVSIGNLSTGGAGKTPLAIALAQALTARGLRVDVLSRGYGRKSKAPARVDPNGTAEEFGDEPLLIARAAGVPVYVAAERVQAGRLAEAELPGEILKGNSLSRAEAAEGIPRPIHLLDDGFQHRQLARAVDILLLNRADWQDRLLPAGHLREPLHAIHRATILALPAGDPELEAAIRSWGWQGPVWRLRRSMGVPAVDGPVVAFCGIARPQQFFAGLEAAGVQVASRVAFADHHRYIQHDLDCLLAAAQTVRATTLLTTEKDRVRLGVFAASLPAPLTLQTAQLSVEIEDETAAIDALLKQINALSS